MRSHLLGSLLVGTALTALLALTSYAHAYDAPMIGHIAIGVLAPSWGRVMGFL